MNFLFALGKALRGSRRLRPRLELLPDRQHEAARASLLRPGADRGDERPPGAGILRRIPASPARGAGLADPAPIFILGLPRSGSTLLEQILASHSQVEGTSELPYLGRVATWLNRNRADGINYPGGRARTRARKLRGAGRGLPGTRAHAPPLGRAAIHRQDAEQLSRTSASSSLILPNARIIDARRHPLDACLCCYRQLFAKGQAFTYDLTEIGEYYLQYQRMMDHWADVLPGRVLTVQYEEVVSDFETQVRRLLDFCGLPWEDACLRFYESDRPVRTPSSEQVRQPIYDRSVGHWRHYDQLTSTS